jgi:hypothetical protein
MGVIGELFGLSSNQCGSHPSLQLTRMYDRNSGVGLVAAVSIFKRKQFDGVAMEELIVVYVYYHANARGSCECRVNCSVLSPDVRNIIPSPSS